MMTMSRRRLAMVAAGLAALVALGGCGADAGESGDAATEGRGTNPGAAGAGPGEAAPDPGRADPDQPDPGGAAGGTVFDTRSIIYTGQITVRVSDVDAAARSATELAARYGGFIGGDHRSDRGDPGEARATLELRIPADEFTAAVNELSELGDEESREVQTEDVTEEVVDLQTRIATALASVERTRALLERADSIDDIVAVEAELSEREAALASLQARQRRLADLSTLSTITATLLAQEAEPPAVDDEDRTGFLAGLAAGWRGFTASMTVLLTGFGVLLPWLVAFGVPTAGAVWWARRRRALHPAPAAGPATNEPPPGPPARGATEGRQ
jgi:hypothetical protein